MIRSLTSGALKCAFALLAIVIALAGSAAAQTPPAPVWRSDLAHLGNDRAAIRACLESQSGRPSALACVDRVRQACEEGAALELASTTAFQRRCAWRAIAAWEDELSEVRASLRAVMRPAELAAEEAAHSAFAAHVDANTRLHAAQFEGGSLAGVVAGEVRARMLAQRAIELRALLTERQAQ